MINNAAVMRRVLNGELTLRLYQGFDGSRPVELTGGGYAPHPITSDEWILRDGIAEAPVKLFRFDGSQRILAIGGYVTEPDGTVVWALPFPDGPIEVKRRGDTIPVRPIMKLGAQPT